MTQAERILARLDQGALCGMEPLRWEPPITRVAARIFDLREDGHDIVARETCGFHREPQHHAVYELVTQRQDVLF